MKKYSVKIIKEINDPIVNETFFYKILRFLIRLLLNLPFNTRVLLSIIRKFIFSNTNSEILIIKNIFYNDYINYLSEGKLKEILKIKLKWANYIISNKNIHNKCSIKLAISYRELIKKEKNNYFPKFKSCNNNNIDFYIYGPNSKLSPKKEFSRSTIILTKFPNVSINNFEKKILFLNHITLNKTDKNSLIYKCKNFDRVFIPFGNKKIISKMKYIPELPLDNLASPMGLARILSFIKNKNRKPLLLIEGFDLGTYKNAYSGKIESFYDKNNFDINYLFDLMHHDHIYNFLFLKSLLSHFRFYKSDEFLNIINKDLKEYFDNSYKIRNFKNIKFKLF